MVDATQAIVPKISAKEEVVTWVFGIWILSIENFLNFSPFSVFTI